LALARQRSNDCPNANISSFPNSWVIPNNPAICQVFSAFWLGLAGSLVAMGDYTAANLLSSRFGTGDVDQRAQVLGCR